MPKRSAQEKIKHYEEKIRKLQNTRSYRRLRIIESDSDSEERNEENEVAIESSSALHTASDDAQQEDGLSPERLATQPEIELDQPSTSGVQLPTSGDQPLTSGDQPPTSGDQPPTSGDQPADTESLEPDLDPELLIALGESVDEMPEYGVKIHDNLAKIWLPLLKKGLTKENKEKLIKQYLIPENCKLFQAPKLNAEISAAIPDVVRHRDKSLMTQQQDLGYGVTAINRGIDLLLKGEDKKLAIHHLSNGCRILSDLHSFFTQNRIKLLTPNLDKNILHIIQDAERDETLFGKKLSDNIKAAKAIQRQGQQIKKATNSRSSNSFQSQTHRSSYQGNWNAPPRVPSSRGSRGGQRRGSYQPRRPYLSTSSNAMAPPATTKPSAAASKPRAPTS